MALFHHSIQTTVFTHFIRLMFMYLQTLKIIMGLDYFDPGKKFMYLIGQVLCRDKAPTQAICENYWFLMMGYDSDQLNTVSFDCWMLFIFMSFSFSWYPFADHTTDHVSTCSRRFQHRFCKILGFSMQCNRFRLARTNQKNHEFNIILSFQLIHFGQSVKTGYFRKFDHGFMKNKIVYKQFTPPDYKLENARVPTALYYSQNDWMASIEDVLILRDRLPNLVKDYLIPHKQFKYVQWYINSLFLIMHIF